jgi:hypothetical protein
MFRCLLWAIAAAVRPKVLLIADNLCLRQQLVVLQRRNPRPRFEDADRSLILAPYSRQNPGSGDPRRAFCSGGAADCDGIVDDRHMLHSPSASTAPCAPLRPLSD